MSNTEIIRRSKAESHHMTVVAWMTFIGGRFGKYCGEIEKSRLINITLQVGRDS